MRNIILKKSIFTVVLSVLAWSQAFSQAPAPPVTNDGAVNNCDNSVFLYAYSENPPTGLTHKWYLSETGTQTLSPSQITIFPLEFPDSEYVTQIEVYQSVTYWVAARNSSGQESIRKRAKATISSSSSTPPSLSLGTDSSPLCGPTGTFELYAGGGR